ncbi:hypothetical protein QJQ45_004917 [Haematococcus lacustris]|nr:hypothetical protein QJQ45_004917 [Haematococcus lacustris]
MPLAAATSDKNSAAIAPTWSQAPACDYKLTDTNGVPDSFGRRWGAHADGSTCAFKSATGTPLHTWNTAPRCLQVDPVTSSSPPDSESHIWASDGSCAFKDAALSPIYTWPSAPRCQNQPSVGTAVPDFSGKLWGWESGSACAYRTTDGSQVSFDLLRLWAPESETPGSPHHTGPVTRHLLATSGWWWAPACKNTVSTSHAVDKVDSSLLWGSDSGSSCAFKDSNGKPLQLWDITPVCTSNTQVVRDSVGRSWGWQDGRSCRATGAAPSPSSSPVATSTSTIMTFTSTPSGTVTKTWTSRGTCSQANLDQAATCPDLPTMDSAQVDSTGYLWGCNGASSCRYRYNGKLIYYAALLTGNWDQTPAPLPTGYGWLDSPRCAQTPTYSSSQPDAQGFPVFQQDLAAGNVASYYNDVSDCDSDSESLQRIGESRWRPLELCWWPQQVALPAKGNEYPGLGYKRLRDRPPKAQQQQPAEAHSSTTAQPSNAAVVAVAGPGQSVDKVLVVKNGVTQVNSTTSSGDGKTSSGGKINIEHDSYGNPWAWDTARNQSCAVRNDSATLLTDFQAATRCKSSPTAYNSKPDTYGNLWGWENNSSCAFRDGSDRPLALRIIPVPIKINRKLLQTASAVASAIASASSASTGPSSATAKSVAAADGSQPGSNANAVANSTAVATNGTAVSNSASLASAAANSSATARTNTVALVGTRGFENGSSCAYKAANGAAIFYQGYVQSGAYSSPSSAWMASSSTASASSAVVTSWETAPACRQAVTDFNYQPDSAGRKWGWDGSVSCKYVDASGNALIAYEGQATFATGSQDTATVTCSSQAATPPSASDPGPSTPSPAKRTKAEQAAGTSQPTKGKGKGKAAKAKSAPQPGGSWTGTATQR